MDPYTDCSTVHCVLQLQVHIRSHTNERPFSCIYCSASFTIKTNLERHLKTRHPQRPPYIPDVMAMTTDEGIPERLDDDSSMDTKETDTSNHTIQPLMISVSPKSSLGKCGHLLAIYEILFLNITAHCSMYRDNKQNLLMKSLLVISL